MRARPDGSATLAGELTAECAERLLGVFDALGAPKPETHGVKDPRSAGQRRHDALLDALTRLARSDTLPTSAGVRHHRHRHRRRRHLAHRTRMREHQPRRPRARRGRRSAGAAPTSDWSLSSPPTPPTPRHRRHRGGAVVAQISHHTAVHPAATPRADRPRPRLHLPRLRHPARLDPDPPHHRLATRRHHDPGQRRHGLPLPPRALRPTRLAMRVPQRPTSLDPARAPRPRPETTTQPATREHRAGDETRGRPSARLPRWASC